MALRDRIRERMSNFVERVEGLREFLDDLDLEDLKLLLPLLQLLLEEKKAEDE